MHTILLADDNEDSRTIYGTFLEAFGYRILEAEDGRGAVEMAARELPDVVLLNLYMPGMNGHQVLEALQTDPRTQKVRCLVLSGDVRHHQMGAALQGGAEAFLTKPAEPREVLEMVQAILREPLA